MTSDSAVVAPRRFGSWPWVLLLAALFPAVWHAASFPSELDDEFPRVERPTFSRRPPPGYRLAEPGDTIDRVGIYVSSLAAVLAVGGLLCGSRAGRGPRVAALAVSLGAFWLAANPGPTFDRWHGLGWRAMADPTAPMALRGALTAGLLVLIAMVVLGIGPAPSNWKARWGQARSSGVAALLVVAALLGVARGFDVPGVEPAGYWPRWAMVWGLIAFSVVLVRTWPGSLRTWRPALRTAVAGTAAWYLLVVGGIWLTWYHRPLERLREVVPGRIFISAMPTARGLEIAQARHGFRTIINLFPEDTPQRSPRLPEELAFVRKYGLQYVRSPASLVSSDEFLDLTLRLAQDPDAWPVLVHCHGCMDRTPAWVGIYQFVVEGRPLEESLRFIEQHRGYRPKASVTLLYNRVLPRLAPDRVRTDPTVALLRRCAEGTVDPFDADLRAELRIKGANPEAAGRVTVRQERPPAVSPSLTPRR